jgi:class 3 adenylate cyclase
MAEIRPILLTDVVDSTQLAQALGEAELSALWQAHDRLARDLLSAWRGREIDKTDGFLLLFGDAADAAGYMGYQRRDGWPCRACAASGGARNVTPSRRQLRQSLAHDVFR